MLFLCFCFTVFKQTEALVCFKITLAVSHIVNNVLYIPLQLHLQFLFRIAVCDKTRKKLKLYL